MAKSEHYRAALERINKLSTDRARIEKDADRLYNEKCDIQAELERLRAENERLHGDLFALRVEVERLRDFMNWSAAADVMRWETDWNLRR